MITITKETAKTVTLELRDKAMPLAKFISAITPPKLDYVLPNGVKMVVQHGKGFMVVYEIPPGAHSLKWQERIEHKGEDDSFAYKKRHLALPYVILLVPFYFDGYGILVPHTSAIECYYRNKPLSDPDDELFYPALLNCGLWPNHSVELPSWICMSRLMLGTKLDGQDNARRLWITIGAVRNHFFGATFNWEWAHQWMDYCKWEHADKRITNIDRWEQESKKDPSFILKVKWMPAIRNLRQTIDHTLTGLFPHIPRVLQNIIINHK